MPTTDPPDRLRVAEFNLLLMIKDTELALRKKIPGPSREVDYLVGLLNGLVGAKKILDGSTADEAWETLQKLADLLPEKETT